MGFARQYDETTDPEGYGHAVDAMDAASEARRYLVKIYLDEIDTLANYRYVFP